MHDNTLVKICMLVVILFGGFCVYWKLINFNKKTKKRLEMYDLHVSKFI